MVGTKCIISFRHLKTPITLHFGLAYFVLKRVCIQNFLENALEKTSIINFSKF